MRSNGSIPLLRRHLPANICYTLAKVPPSVLSILLVLMVVLAVLRVRRAAERQVIVAVPPPIVSTAGSEQLVPVDYCSGV